MSFSMGSGSLACRAIALGERGLGPYIWAAVAEKQSVHWLGGPQIETKRAASTLTS
jgi:hypothetical protein